MQCLIAAKPILKVEYFEAWHKSLEDDPTSPVPTFDSFIPQIDAQLAHLNELIFLPRTERCRIFKVANRLKLNRRRERYNDFLSASGH